MQMEKLTSEMVMAHLYGSQYTVIAITIHIDLCNRLYIMKNIENHKVKSCYKHSQ